MIITRRDALKLAAGSAAEPLAGQTKAPREPFQPAWESLQQYHCPEWFRDAKLGVWAHWGPQGGPKQGDWYARNIYIQGSRQNKCHVEHFGRLQRSATKT
jgi:alpha-L-fucosidase